MGVLILRCYIVHDGSGAGSAWSRGGRDLSGALLAVVVTLLLRCLGVRWGWSPKGPRPGSEPRAGFGSRGLAWARLWTHDSSFLRFWAKVLRLRVRAVDLPPSERSTGGRSTAGGARCGNDASFSWTVPGEVRISRPPNANGTRDASFTRARPNASAFTTGSRRQRRTFGTPTFERRTLRPPQHPPTARDQRIRRPPGRGPFGDRPQRRPRQRSSSPRPPAAAQQHDETPAAAHLQPKTPYARGARGDRR